VLNPEVHQQIVLEWDACRQCCRTSEGVVRGRVEAIQAALSEAFHTTTASQDRDPSSKAAGLHSAAKQVARLVRGYFDETLGPRVEEGTESARPEGHELFCKAVRELLVLALALGEGKPPAKWKEAIRAIPVDTEPATLSDPRWRWLLLTPSTEHRWGGGTPAEAQENRTRITDRLSKFAQCCLASPASREPASRTGRYEGCPLAVPIGLCGAVDGLVAWLGAAQSFVALEGELDQLAEMQGHLAELKGQEAAHADRAEKKEPRVQTPIWGS